ncbi:SAF domain-containing protein [Cupriavidus basilensis]
MCVADTSPGQEILKYGQIIGRASHAIRAGEHMHVHNIESQCARRLAQGLRQMPTTFLGYPREKRRGRRAQLGRRGLGHGQLQPGHAHHCAHRGRLHPGHHAVRARAVRRRPRFRL